MPQYRSCAAARLTAVIVPKLADSFGIVIKLSDSTNDGGDVAHVPRPDKEGDVGACAPIPILCSCEADCPRFAKSPLPPWLTSERSGNACELLRIWDFLNRAISGSAEEISLSRF